MTRLFSTAATREVWAACVALLAIGAATRSASTVAAGAGMALALVLARAQSGLEVAALRRAGFEMVWSVRRRVTTCARGESVQLTLELRNKSAVDTQVVSVRAIASSELEAHVAPARALLPAGARLTFDVTIVPTRVGRWGVHGLALELQSAALGGDGLFEAPLMFANPHGIEVRPAALHLASRRPEGGRMRRAAEPRRSAPRVGDGLRFRELRDHVPGDPFKRIAWRASARRGKLLVREMDDEGARAMMLVVDASVDLWAGVPGRAPLDRAVEEAAAVASRALRQGAAVGLVVYASRVRTWLDPAEGPAQAQRIAAALTSAASLADVERCDLDELELAARVAEHMRPLDASSLAGGDSTDLDALAARADALKARAPFAPRAPTARSPRERRFRAYLAAFGCDFTPRAEGERSAADATLVEVLERVAKQRKQRPDEVHVYAPAPNEAPHLRATVRRLRARRVAVSWTYPTHLASISESNREIVAVAADAVWMRLVADSARSAATIRALGARPTALGDRVTTPQEVDRT